MIRNTVDYAFEPGVVMTLVNAFDNTRIPYYAAHFFGVLYYVSFFCTRVKTLVHKYICVFAAGGKRRTQKIDLGRGYICISPVGIAQPVRAAVAVVIGVKAL